MNTPKRVTIITPDIQSNDPMSPSNLMKKAMLQEIQSTADTKYDAKPPARLEGFTINSGLLCNLFSTNQNHIKYQNTINITTSYLITASVFLIIYSMIQY